MEFARLYTAPGVDHVGFGAPANVDMLSVLVDWVEKAPGDLEVAEQKLEAPAFDILRALPLCRWPARPHYRREIPRVIRVFYVRNDAVEAIIVRADQGIEWTFLLRRMIRFVILLKHASRQTHFPPSLQSGKHIARTEFFSV